MKPRYITDNKGNKTNIILPIEKYEKMMEELEEFEDINAFDKAVEQKQEFRPAKEVFDEIERKRAI